MKVPVIEERIHLAEEDLRNILRQALWARRCEEIVGDYVHICEDNTDFFQYLRAQLVEQHAAALDLAHRGMIALDVAASINDHLLEAVEDETHNLAVQAAIVDLEGHYDTVESGLFRQACAVKRLLVSLKVQRDDLIRKNAKNKSEGSLPVDRKRKSSPIPSTSCANVDLSD